jgi:hypothetical protein
VAIAEPLPAGAAEVEVPATDVDGPAVVPLAAGVLLAAEPHAVRLARATTPAAANAAGIARPAGNLTGNMRPPPDITPDSYPMHPCRN